MKKSLIAVSLAALGLVGYAAAQVTLPKVTNVGTSDLFNVVVNGVPVAGNRYATAAQINGVQGYYVLYSGADANGQTLTYTQTSGISNVFAYATTGAITSVTITTDPNPGDGERLCYVGDGEATTTLTFTANTGQTIKPTISAGVSDVPICLTYVASLSSWYRSN